MKSLRCWKLGKSELINCNSSLKKQETKLKKINHEVNLIKKLLAS